MGGCFTKAGLRTCTKGFLLGSCTFTQFHVCFRAGKPTAWASFYKVPLAEAITLISQSMRMCTMHDFKALLVWLSGSVLIKCVAYLHVRLRLLYTLHRLQCSAQVKDHRTFRCA